MRRGLILVCLCATLWLVIGQGVHAHEPPVFAPESSEGQALAYLKAMPREWSGTSDHDCHTYDDKNLERLKGPFLVASTAFLQAFVQTHGAATITSAHRSADEQYCVCVGERGPCAGKGIPVHTKAGAQALKTAFLSRHQLGIAMDVRAGTGSEHEFICMHEFARANPQFGVYFPLGRADYPHMELIGSRGPPPKLASVKAGAVKITPCQKMKVMLTYDHLD